MMKWKRCPNRLDYRDWSSGVLKCRVCGDENTHQAKIEVFIRDGDDGRLPGVKTTIDGEITTVSRDDMDSNPSGRRDGIRIYFWCESCHFDNDGRPHYELLIYQHKGQTLCDTVYYIEDKS